jgi:hypothetical protein
VLRLRLAFDTCFNLGECALPLLTAGANPIAAKNPDIKWAANTARWVTGTKELGETKKAVARYTLAPVADRIRKDVLILAGAEDHFILFHQTPDFEKALVNARSVTTQIFDRASGGAAHCQAGNLSLWFMPPSSIWLLAKFPGAAA